MSAVFTRLALENWRNFKRVEIPLAARAFVVGPNASGKSNLLDALRFLRDIAAPDGSLVRAVEERRGLKHLRSLDAGAASRIRLEVSMRIGDEPAEWRYVLELSGAETRQRPMRVDTEIVEHGQRTVLERSAQREPDPRLLVQTHLEQISQSLDFAPLVEALASVTDIHIVPQVARTPARAEEFSRHEAPGSDFIDRIARLPAREQERMLKRIEKLLRIAVPRFSELAVERDEVGRPHLKARYAHWRRRGGWQNEQEFSDGTLRLIGLLWALDRGSSPLLLEEPELSLHRDVIRQLPRMLAQGARRSGRQTIVSTHAEEVLHDTGIDPSEIFLLQPDEYETRVVAGSEIPELVAAARARVPLGRLVTSMTRPADIEQLSLPLGGRAQR